MEPTLNDKPLQNFTPNERIALVKRIFNSVTPHYDLLNRLMSARQDVRWRKFTAKRIPTDATRVLDVATGTGDLAIEIAHRRPQVQIAGVDFVERMMRPAQTKTVARGLNGRIAYAAGDALALPFRDDEFDAATIAFGIRNIPDRAAALREMARVVKPGGKVMVLEMTFPKSLGLRRFFEWYLNHVMPVVGRTISGNQEAYRYLPASIQDFLHPDELARLFSEVGLSSVKAFPLTLGITYLHEGIVP
ncbi:MAG: bifunctional demethylmenaquinone methyltransferase/2-methoxy-6-polyprenyl-1,4-benzoquinol methylase UbiE [Desulfomonile sp.]|nr:bifunctional demethylmenaquinone methyltransferase/2-methoxy-6-polyprenyl-1,4-benzoquinol methylase UbiE [Desulfomonile sp.]